MVDFYTSILPYLKGNDSYKLEDGIRTGRFFILT
jgi:hypothetical protein